MRNVEMDIILIEFNAAIHRDNIKRFNMRLNEMKAKIRFTNMYDHFNKEDDFTYEKGDYKS
ncbi:hypothetical protein BpHYR1_034155 [Brachionus plicatilis]|uniref:Uncharacterized protein n=1 Tax=Brachionus plicatilis TaxID=10195 RepID=A0A3M7S689_BRAPC|nr:hypothetical protein BpHYR1_034155 [Brachionus plicatilis]